MIDGCLETEDQRPKTQKLLRRFAWSDIGVLFGLRFPNPMMDVWKPKTEDLRLMKNLKRGARLASYIFGFRFPNQMMSVSKPKTKDLRLKQNLGVEQDRRLSSAFVFQIR